MLFDYCRNYAKLETTFNSPPQRKNSANDASCRVIGCGHSRQQQDSPIALAALANNAAEQLVGIALGADVLSANSNTAFFMGKGRPDPLIFYQPFYL
jgi:hypothetical protein